MQAPRTLLIFRFIGVVVVIFLRAFVVLPLNLVRCVAELNFEFDDSSSTKVLPKNDD